MLLKQTQKVHAVQIIAFFSSFFECIDIDVYGKSCVLNKLFGLLKTKKKKTIKDFSFFRLKEIVTNVRISQNQLANCSKVVKTYLRSNSSTNSIRDN